MAEKYHDTILAIITEKGELGVNEIARLAEMPLSTVQKFLERQTYFKKTERRKWDLPQNVNADIKSDTLSLMVNSVENALLLVKSQLTDLQDSVQNSLVPVNTLKRGIDTLSAPVAAKSVDIDLRLIDRDKKAKDTMMVFKHYASKLTEEYKNLLLNVDLVLLTIERGTNYVNGTFTDDISDLLLEKATELPNETLLLLKEYQKGE